jgi:adenylate cyclase
MVDEERFRCFGIATISRISYIQKGPKCWEVNYLFFTVFMTIPEEIEQLKIKLEQTADDRAKADVLLEILKKYDSINSTETQSYIDQLLQLAEKLNDSFSKAKGFCQLALLKRMKGEYNASLDLSERSILLFQHIDRHHDIAICYNNIGNIHELKGNYSDAMKNHLLSLQIRKEADDKFGMASSFNNIGNICFHQGNFPEALNNYLASLQIKKELGDKKGIANSYHNIGNIYKGQNDFAKALKNHLLSLQIREEIGDKNGIATSFNNIGNIYGNQGNYSEALKNYFAALNSFEEIGDKYGIAVSHGYIGNIYADQGNYRDALKNHLLFLQNSEEIGDKYGIAYSHLNIGEAHYKGGNYEQSMKSELSAFQMGEEIGNKEVIKVSAELLYNIYKARGDFENALRYHEKYHDVDNEMLGEQAQKQLTSLNFMHNMEQKEKDLEIEQLRNVELKKERDRSESLLLNILPAEVAEELKNKGTADAKLFDDVTVLFTDFKSFTTVIERLSPQQLVDELHACFSVFDEICTKYNIEKIKTVGDAYLAVSGLPLANANHASDVIHAAIEIRAFIKKRVKLKGENTFGVRIGVHSGSVVAGIVGVKKYAYDIWGDTVNTAARMEQTSEAGKINISETTFQLVKQNFNCKYRGELEAKNKGKLKMYFVQ